ncbi:hypothetical protein PU560_03995, partial [Georgenia sp. 10Sc9-8]|nr:hypothetical protein [Georgenia halotolerans]
MSRRTQVAQEAARDTTIAELDGSRRRGRGRGVLFQALLLLCILVAVSTLIAVLLHAFVQGLPRLDANLLRNMPSTIDTDTS